MVGTFLIQLFSRFLKFFKKMGLISKTLPKGKEVGQVNKELEILLKNLMQPVIKIS